MILGQYPALLGVFAAADGAAAVTDLSQEQFDDMARRGGTVAWDITGRWVGIGIVTDDGIIPLARFDVRDRVQRRALEDVVRLGTLHLVAGESVDDSGASGGLSFDARPPDRAFIRTALDRKRGRR